jgi:UDP-N-acetylglucosamine 2-epimerase (non-hydrolysing)
LILVTAHRRESFGEPFKRICEALETIVRNYPDVKILYPVHYNPNVQDAVCKLLRGKQRIYLTNPIDYETFVHLMKLSYLVLTDSGGIQEEAPALGKPVLVMRDVTERPEAVAAGTVKVIGTNVRNIVDACDNLLVNAGAYKQMARAVSPYGDGRAAERIVKILLDEMR